jgi:ABC-type transport system involved in multi-copper enzyme maturation permease subunit
MRELWRAFSAEVHKNKHSKIRWITVIAIALGPIFGGVFLYMMLGNGYEGLSGSFKAKATMMSFQADWKSLISLLSQVIGIGGIIIFGFVASWLFGREYSDGTAKDLLSLPISRTKIIHAKFIYYVLWCFTLVLVNLFLGLLIGALLQIPGWDFYFFADRMKIYFYTTVMIIILNTPVAFLAISGKGYLAPLGFVVLTLVFAQIIAAMGFGIYFPWSVPGIYTGSGGDVLRSQLNIYSYLTILMTNIIGYVATILWWKYTDQTI